MISIKNTPNWAGVTITGSYDDLEQLVEAFYEITIDEFTEKRKDIPYIPMSNRVLGLCYDVRHAFMGDRSVEKGEDGTLYSCDYYYPEMFYLMLALDDLIKLRIEKITKSKFVYEEALYPQACWDEPIAAIRSFQAAFKKNMASFLPASSMTRWMNMMKRSRGIVNMASQFLDQLNIQHLISTKATREKKLLSLTKSITQFPMDKEYQKIDMSLQMAAKEYGCSPSELRLSDMEYPEHIDW